MERIMQVIFGLTGVNKLTIRLECEREGYYRHVEKMSDRLRERLVFVSNENHLCVIRSTMRCCGAVRRICRTDIYMAIEFVFHWHNSITYVRMISAVGANSAFVIVEHSELNKSASSLFCKHLPYAIASSPALTLVHAEGDCSPFHLDDVGYVVQHLRDMFVVVGRVHSDHRHT